MIPGVVAGGMRRVVVPPTPTDPYFPFVELQLHMDGVNGSTTFTDTSSRARAMSPGVATISTAQSKFGGASGFFPSSQAGFLQVNGSNNLAFGTSDFRIDCWIYNNGSINSNLTGLVSWGESTGQFYWQIDGTNFFGPGSGFVAHNLPLNQWSFISCSRISNTMRFHVNGAQVGASWTRTTNFIAVADRPRIGAHTTSQGLGSYLDDLRITVGTVNPDFTPPTTAWSNS